MNVRFIVRFEQKERLLYVVSLEYNIHCPYEEEDAQDEVLAQTETKSTDSENGFKNYSKKYRIHSGWKSFQTQIEKMRMVYPERLPTYIKPSESPIDNPENSKISSKDITNFVRVVCNSD